MKNKWFCRLLMTVLGLLLAGSINMIAPMAASAEPSKQVEITGDGVAAPKAFTLAQLQAMEQYQHVYSTINTWPTKKWYVGKGVKLRDLLALAGVKKDARLINFISNDGYTVTLTVKELLEDKRYYFPHLKDNHPSDGSIPGSPEGRTEVEPIIVLLSAEGSNNPADMNDMDALLLMCGQRAVTEQTNNLFLKYINKIEVLTAAPPKWDNPKANISSGEVSAGTLIELSNKSNDADKIYYTTDGTTPTVNSPIFNWSAKRWWGQRPDSLKSINKPIEIKDGTIIKAITIGPGKEDSDVVTFSYRIGAGNNAGGQRKAPPTGVSLDENMINLRVGGTFLLAATVGPDNAIDKSVTWSSSDTRVATVDNQGLVTLVGPGTAVITVKTVTGNLTATCTVKSANNGVAGQSAVPADTDSQRNEAQETPVKPQVPEANRQYPADKETVQKPSAVLRVPEEANWRYLAEKELATAHSANADASFQWPDSQSWHIFEMSVDTVPIQLLMDQSVHNIYQGLIFLLLFLVGAGRRFTEYTKEVTR